MSREQRAQVDRMLREGPLDVGGDVAAQRKVFADMMQAQPVPDDVTARSAAYGGVPVIEIDIAGIDTQDTLVYVHGGAYAIGTAEASVGLASDLARRCGARAISVDYRLAPEHPYPSALDDVVAVWTALLRDRPGHRMVLVGESAGGGLAIASLLAMRTAGLDLPAAVALMSPWADLTLSGDSVTAKAAVDPALTPDGLRSRAADYTAGTDAGNPLVSPVFADLAGLPPLLIQAGSHEILLDDATRLATRAASADVAVTMQITPQVPHVFQGFANLLDEGDEALADAASFLARHLKTTAAA